jgi:hypothetical protein
MMLFESLNSLGQQVNSPFKFNDFKGGTKIPCPYLHFILTIVIDYGNVMTTLTGVGYHSRHDRLLFPDEALEMHGEGSVRPAVSNVNLFILSIKNNAGLYRRVGGSILKHLPLAGR